MPGRGKSITVWLSEAEYEELSRRAGEARKSPSPFTSELVRSYLRTTGEAEATKRHTELSEKVAELHRGLCAGLEYLFISQGLFDSEEDARSWVMKYVRRA